ncbi:unnamed protein product [Rotaria magnacalcarata]|uniref:LisH domain-containing protein n=5 Tax=Rotaria magnacalcarata TaxID=392030 RepID=A0A819CKA0_9BILA|nr:unnamed protein product [Rotaria magnacalcarata]CAF2144266.1 unnamed protein product [Rotaria magnacalcarata]CAF3821327.1 unnamed protein product [Rotaria magnacalcarata]CAF3847117.1 unnamed protein product [Rotaria magnacalcarata]
MSSDVMNILTGTSNSDELSEPPSGNENELRELVYQALEREGLINRLKAQLRVAVFKTIEKAANSNGTDTRSSLDDGMTGRICRALVFDWLEHSQLLYTQDIFKVETSGSKYPTPLTHTELLEQLHINSNQTKAQPILHLLLDQSAKQSPSTTNSLPDFIKQSIDNQFPNEKINDLQRIRDHFRSLFSSAFDSSVLDAFINKNIPSTLASLAKHDYEQTCLKWIQACTNALIPSSSPVQQVTSLGSTPLLTARNTTSNDPKKPSSANQAKSPPSDSSSSSSSSSKNQRKPAFDFALPTTANSSANVVKKSTDIVPPPLIDFNDSSDSSSSSSSDQHEEEDASASIFSKRNATAAEIEKLKKIDVIIQGNTTPRTRTILKNTSANGSKDLPIEYDDESVSHSVSHSIISSVDDITVDKVSPSPSIPIDYLEDFDKN